MFFTRLAFKNLVRHRNRTLITASIIAFAVFYFIIFDSLIGGMTEFSYKSIIDYEAGHLQVTNKEYWQEKEEFPLENLFSIDQKVMSAVKNVEGYQASSPELNFKTRLNKGSKELPVVGKGIIPDMFKKTYKFEDQFVAGSMFSPGEYKGVIGKRLADLLKVKTGDYIILLVKDKNETFNTIEVEISGLVHTGNPNVNRNVVYLPLNIVQQALNVGDQVSKITVRLKDKGLAAKAGNEMKDKLMQVGDDLSVHLWNELEAVSVAGAKQSANQLILAIILVIAAIAIINTVILAALERVEEIGMMKAMGLRVKEIVYIFVLESTGIGILGGLFGVMMGFVGVWFLSRYGLDFTSIIEVDITAFGIPVIGKLYGVWKPISFIKVFSFGVVVSMVSSILPAYWAARKGPVKAIHHI